MYGLSQNLYHLCFLDGFKNKQHKNSLFIIFLLQGFDKTFFIFQIGSFNIFYTNKIKLYFFIKIYLCKKKYMKKIIGFILMGAASVLFAQTGINTENPKATLDVSAKKEVLTIAGLLPPRLTRAELTEKGNTLYGKEQDGAIIYITDASGGDALSQREHIQSKGLYIFDADEANKEGRWMCLLCYGFA
ncbi:hypothetical protein CEQ15_12765 [Chryseobacterium indologenes]|nr:hypothetical protein CEQ15_12765 [Chryseobacterium indologenes]